MYYPCTLLLIFELCGFFYPSHNGERRKKCSTVFRMAYTIVFFCFFSFHCFAKTLREHNFSCIRLPVISHFDSGSWLAGGSGSLNFLPVGLVVETDFNPARRKLVNWLSFRTTGFLFIRLGNFSQ